MIDTSVTSITPNQLEAHWMPFTSNRQFRTDPRIMIGAHGAHYTTADGRTVFDGLSGLWTCGLGHGVPTITEAVSRQLATLDYAPAFQFGQPLSFELAERIVDLTPAGLDHVLFTCSGSEAVDTALKLARGYWRAMGQAGKTTFIGRTRSYHGSNFGGMGIGGQSGNRTLFGPGIDADYLRATLLPGNAFSWGQPATGEELADELQAILDVHDPSTVAAVIVEPVTGGGGVLPPPVGYLDRLREICTRNNVLLIFDEVITGFGRLGAWTGSEAFGVTPDIMTFAKQITNGAIPMGGVVVSDAIQQAYFAISGSEYGVELPHGYTYSAHPAACAAALATLDALQEMDAPAVVTELASHFAVAVHTLDGAPFVTDVRNIGLAAALSLEPFPGEPARRPFEVALECWRAGYYVRFSGDTIQLAPPFVSTPAQLDDLVAAIGSALQLHSSQQV